MATTFTRNTVDTIGQELQAAIAGVLAKHGLVATRRGKFNTGTYEVTFTLVDGNPGTTITNYAGQERAVTTEELQRGGYFGNNLLAMIRDSTGYHQVRITKRAVKKYQYVYITGPNVGRPFTGDFCMFSAMPASEVAAV